MTKADLIDKMAKDAKISKVAAGTVLDSFMENVTKALKKKDGKVTLVGFGTFMKVRQKARKGRNPQTGAPIKCLVFGCRLFSHETLDEADDQHDDNSTDTSSRDLIDDATVTDAQHSE